MVRRQFTREFRLEAVRLIKQRGVSPSFRQSGSTPELAGSSTSRCGAAHASLANVGTLAGFARIMVRVTLSDACALRVGILRFFGAGHHNCR